MAVQQHADIIAVSYEARKLGVKKHMPIGFIRQKYPSVKLVHVQVMTLHMYVGVESCQGFVKCGGIMASDQGRMSFPSSRLTLYCAVGEIGGGFSNNTVQYSAAFSAASLKRLSQCVIV